MEKGKVVIKRHGLVILRDNDVTLVSKTPYLSVADGALDQVLDNEQVTHTYNDHVAAELDDVSVKDQWKEVEVIFNSLGTNNELLKTLLEQLRMVKSMHDLESIYHKVLSSLSLVDKRTIIELHKSYPELVLSIMAKTITQNYVKGQLRRFIPSKIIYLENRKAQGESLEIIMEDVLDLDFNKKIMNGMDLLIEKSLSDELDRLYKTLGSSCWDCANGYVGSCEKIADYPEKKDIGEYPFITDGFQWYVNDELERFSVIRCSNYEKASKSIPLSERGRKRAEINKIRIREAKELIHLLYRDVDTLGEAIEIDNKNKALGYK